LTDTSPTPAPPLDTALNIDPERPLIVVDVDEVLAMFMEGFERFIGRHGLEMRIDKFALFQNIYRPGETQHLDVAAGRKLFEDFFESDVGDIDVAPGAVEAMAAWARSATIVILTNAPDQSRRKRAQWLIDNAMPYPLIVNSGLKGPPASAPAVRRFQMVADPRLRPYAFCAPERHTRIDHWPTMGKAVADALGLEFP
jgi:hypothetical protein